MKNSNTWIFNSKKHKFIYKSKSNNFININKVVENLKMKSNKFKNGIILPLKENIRLLILSCINLVSDYLSFQK